ncbi:hypothetical protein EMPS_03485 [Entomortierella parvispora]|uniref:Uncharacterized protein n=1 Tax=Entomortierella parvispora TaxID=205924 RepID=A0A9P3H6X7_9FUNG|nr:hypothetical protein EMPS_03485 [Entomortierella parvispora]
MPLPSPPSAPDTTASSSLHTLPMLEEQSQSDRSIPLQAQLLNSGAAASAVGNLSDGSLNNTMLSGPAVGPAGGGSAFNPQDTMQQDISISSVQGSSSSTPSILSGASLGGTFTSFEAATLSASNSPITSIVEPKLASQETLNLLSMTNMPAAVKDKAHSLPTKDGDTDISTKMQTHWNDILISMVSELGFLESSRMMEAEQLVLSRQQRHKAPGIIEKFMKILQGSFTGDVTDESSSFQSTKRQHMNGMDTDGTPDDSDAIKRRRTDNTHPTREEIENSIVDFMAKKREQINESNRQEFTNGRAREGDMSDTPSQVDDGCARVDARKLNRTIQMKLETVKNEALTKTNPKTSQQMNDPNAAINGLDERLKNIQTHLNLRLVASPSCSIAERVRIVEDVIIQLERDYPVWSAVHFNQPDRVFPPPPAVTTVSRDARNQIIMTSGHLATTLVDSGDVAFADLAASAQYSNAGDSRSIPSGGAIHRGIPVGTGMTGSHIVPGVAGRQAIQDLRSPPTLGQQVPGAAGVTGLSGGSATVIKLKRHGGAGSSSLARAVQQQLAQRKAATGGHVIDETKNNGVHAHSSTIRSGTSSSPGSSLSPTMGFSDPLKPGVTGRGPIKSRRKSIAKGLDPASAMASMNVAHASGIHQATGSSVGASSSGTGGVETALGSVKAKPAAARKPRKKKEDNNSDDPLAPPKATVRAGGGRGKGKGGRPPMGLGLGKGKGGAYREEMLRRAEVEEFGDESDDDIDDNQYFESTPSSAQPTASRATLGGNASLAGSGNGTLLQGNNTFATDNSALARLVSSALQDQANSQAQLQQRQLLAQQLQQQQQQQQDQAQSQQQTKAKKQPRKPSTPQKPPPVRKFGGKSFGMAGGESSGSSSNESSDGEGSGSSGSQSDSSSGSISGSDPGDSD